MRYVDSLWEQWNKEDKEKESENARRDDKKRACTSKGNHCLETGEPLSLDCILHSLNEMQTLGVQNMGFWKRTAGNSKWLGVGLLQQGFVLQVLQG